MNPPEKAVEPDVGVVMKGEMQVYTYCVIDVYSVNKLGIHYFCLKALYLNVSTLYLHYLWHTFYS